MAEKLRYASYAASLGVLLLLTACAEDAPNADDDDRFVQMVEEANKTLPPLEKLTPEPLDEADISQHAVQGPSCSYAPGMNLGMRVIARELDAFVKIDGEVQRFAADPGSLLLASGTRAVYSGRSSVLQLSLEVMGEREAEAGSTAARGKTLYNATVELKDPHGRTQYSGDGVAECG